MKKFITAFAVIILLGAAVFFSQTQSPPPAEEETAKNDYKNISYAIEGESIALVNGMAETTAYFGNEIKADLNSDGREDVAFILMQNPGGTGTFYYVVAALNTGNDYQGTNGVFLGDRIAPQTTEFRDGKIIVNYADRKPDEPFAASPSVGVSKYLKVEGGVLVETK